MIRSVPLLIDTLQNALLMEDPSGIVPLLHEDARWLDIHAPSIIRGQEACLHHLKKHWKPCSHVIELERSVGYLTPKQALILQRLQITQDKTIQHMLLSQTASLELDDWRFMHVHCHLNQL